MMTGMTHASLCGFPHNETYAAVRNSAQRRIFIKDVWRGLPREISVGLNPLKLVTNLRSARSLEEAEISRIKSQEP